MEFSEISDLEIFRHNHKDMFEKNYYAHAEFDRRALKNITRIRFLELEATFIKELEEQYKRFQNTVNSYAQD